MENYRSKVLTFIITTCLILFIASYFSKTVIEFYPNFNGLNLFTQIIAKPTLIKKTTTKKSIKKIDLDIGKVHIYNDFEQYNFGNTIVGFNQDETASLSKLQNKLFELSQHKKVKIRIAWFGDSVIEGDLITQQLRKLFNNYFNSDTGVGFLPINTVSSKFRVTGNITCVDSFETNNFMKNPKNLYLSGYSYNAANLEITAINKVKKDKSINLEKWLYCGKGDSVQIEIDQKLKSFRTTKYFNKILLDNSPSNVINFKIRNNSAPIFGVSMEPETGIIIDNFSFRGITGVELRKVQDVLLDEINSNSSYDLVVFQYGVNLLFRSDLDNFNYYYSIMNPVIKKLKNHLNNSEFLVIGCADRAFNYNGEWKTSIGMDSLIKVQAKLAYDNKIPFFNLYESMGGQGTIVKWADTIPRLANKDYIHFNYKGATKVANIIFNAFIADHNKMLKAKSAKIKIEK
jgi:lysophospholipase L1-like esterase/Cu/Ag efflux protein CusF